MNVFLDIKYPEVKNTKNTMDFGYELFNVYAGMKSEFSAISTYSFQSFILPDNISKIIKDIGIVEMRHLDILSELIKQTGLIPYIVSYENNTPIPWNSDFINFSTNYTELLQNDINNENIAIKNYNKLISMTNDQTTINVLKRIILDEEHHIKILTYLLEKARA